ncbi:unnamed protein product [Caenorhabditis sp. 36 PRJEB53466]|nr:unnamed protein product [Caenorhabditis sp. 36 PRJEB53466]
MISCRICDRKAQGVHFGVHSCRACAAFFRRSASLKLHEKGCMSSRCGVEFFHCKPCRLRKCYKTGMDEKKFQFDRDAITSKIMPQSFDTFIGRPQFLHFYDPEATSTSRTFLDLSQLVAKAERIFKHGPGPWSAKGPLRKFANFYNLYEKMPTKMATMDTFSTNDCGDTWEYYFLTTATWLTHFDEFQQLALDVKMKVLFAIWHMWSRLDKLAATALGRRRKMLKTNSMIAQSNGMFVDVNTLELDVSWLCQYHLQHVEFFIDGFRNWDLMDIVDELVELNPSEVELNYMLAQMSFHYAAKRYQGEILEVMERFEKTLADDLHAYYVNERNAANYSARLSRLMKINNAVQASVFKHRPRTEIAKTLNIFTAEYSHPEILFDTGMKAVADCEVCGHKSQGFHFGVLTCRACSAFFRRTATSHWSKVVCQNEKCKNALEGFRVHCKPCRLKRCLMAGMDASKFQYDRDALTNASTKKVPPSFEVFVGRPEYVLFCTPGTSQQISHPKILVDVSNLVNRALKIFENGPETVIVGNCQLQKLAIGFAFNGNVSRKLKTVRLATKETVMKIWEFYFLTTARWLSYFDEFQKLDQQLKLQLLFATWHVWGRLEKLIATAINRRRRVCKSRSELCLFNGVHLDIEKHRTDVSWMSNYPSEQVVPFINGVRSWDLIECIDPLVKLEPSEEEVAFLFGQLLFHYASKRFPGRIETICDRFQEILAQDLHDYYVKEMRMSNYCGRLTRLMKVNGVVQKNIWENRPKIDVAKTFDIFKTTFSHPEMFIDTGF